MTDFVLFIYLRRRKVAYQHMQIGMEAKQEAHSAIPRVFVTTVNNYLQEDLTDILITYIMSDKSSEGNPVHSRLEARHYLLDTHTVTKICVRVNLTFKWKNEPQGPFEGIPNAQHETVFNIVYNEKATPTFMEPLRKFN